MSLKPIDQRSALDKRETLWAEIRKGQPFCLSDLHSVTRMRKDSIRDYVTGLVNAGYVELSKTVPSSNNGTQTKIYRLINDAGVIAPRVRKDGTPVTQGRSRYQLWATMRILGSFDYRSLAISASTEEVPVAATEANAYCQMLAKAGYLKVTAGGKGGTPASYRLLPGQYTGPRPPQIQRVKAVYDPNLGRVVWDSQGGRYDQK